MSPLGLAVSGATVSAAAALQANTKVTGFTIVDSAANILPAVAALSADSKITGITASAAQTANASVLQANAQVTSFSVLDSAANVQAALAGLLADGKLSIITLSDITKPTLTLSAADYAADAAVLAKIVSPYSLVITGGLVTTVAGAAALQADSGVTSFTISDTAAHVRAGITSLMADNKLSAITLTDARTPGLAVTGAVYNAGTALLAKITSPYVLTVSGAAVSQATKLQADTRVTGFAVTDNELRHRAEPRGTDLRISAGHDHARGRRGHDQLCHHTEKRHRGDRQFPVRPGSSGDESQRCPRFCVHRA